MSLNPSLATGSPFEKPEIYNALLHYAAIGLELFGVLVIISGAIAATLGFLYGWGRHKEGAFQAYRAQLGRGILLGLEFLVAADIVGTVAVSPSWKNVGVLALIVLIRTFLSFTLEIEIQGKWPWQKN